MQQSTDNINSFLHTIVCLIILKMWLPSNNHSLFLFRYMIKHKHCHLRHLELLIPLDAADLNDDSEWVLLCPDDCCCIGAIQNHLLVFFGKGEGNRYGGCKGFEKMVGKLIAEVSFAAGESV
jgi:hypothetical protein